MKQIPKQMASIWQAATSATFNKRKAKKYQNHFGTFTYRDISAIVYPLGVLLLF